MGKDNETPRRFPAEWDPTYDGVMISWPHDDTDWAYMLDEIEQNYRELASAILRSGMKLVVVTPEPDHVMEELNAIAHPLGKKNGDDWFIFSVPTNDTWIRDYGFLTALSGEEKLALDFTFNGWGMKFAANLDNQVTRKMACSGFLAAKRENNLDFPLEGGSVESDGKGTVMSTSECLLSANRNDALGKEEIISRLCQSFGASRVLMLNNGYLEGDDTDSHVDTLARMAPDDTIVYVESHNPDDVHTRALDLMKEELKAFRTTDGKPYRLIPVPLPAPIHDEEGQRLPATYANFLATPTAVLLPVYGQPDNDTEAIEAMRKAFPGREIICVDCRPLIKQHGSLHCATMQIPMDMVNTDLAYKS